MGSLRQYLQKRFLLSKCFLGFVVLGLTGCVPATEGRQLEFFFSEKIWGGSPFDEAQKKELFVAALKNKDNESISKPVLFEVNNPLVIVKRADALYEVNANLGLPEVRSGYVLELELPITPLDRVTLTNTLTGVSWSVNLKSE